MEIVWLAFFDGDTKNFQEVILKINAKNFFFVFFSTANRTFYAKKNILYAKKRWKFLLLLYGPFMYALINVW